MAEPNSAREGAATDCAGSAGAAASNAATVNATTVKAATAGAESTTGAEALVSCSRKAHSAWSTVPLAERLGVLRRARHALAERAAELAECVSTRSAAETLTSEVLPLLEAAVFLERNAPRILAPRRLSRRRAPIWLRGIEIEIGREPCGVVLIVAPSNYPLMLAGVQALQALTAGNGVVVKPAPGGRAALEFLAERLREAGLPNGVLGIGAESIAEAERLLRCRVDKVLFTGSAATGHAVLEAASTSMLPAVLELSGNDAAFVRADADLDRTAAALVFGVLLNGGATCVAPRRVFVARELYRELERRLVAALRSAPAVELPSRTAALAAELIDDAVAQGGRVVCGGPRVGAGGGETAFGPALIGDVLPGMRISRSELFAPLLTMTAVDGDDDALRCASASPYALGATVFGRDVDAAGRFARRIDAGTVIVNDTVVPSADPRAPLAPRGASGFGVTRGAEGLLELTRPKAVLFSRRRLPHLSGPVPPAKLVAAYAAAAYGRGGRARLEAINRLLRDGLRELGVRARGSRQRKRPDA